MFLESKERTNHATLHCRMLLVALWPAITLKERKWTSESDNCRILRPTLNMGPEKQASFTLAVGPWLQSQHWRGRAGVSQTKTRLATQQVPRQHGLHGTLSQKQRTCLFRNKTDFPPCLSRRQQIIKETHGLGAKFIADIH